MIAAFCLALFLSSFLPRILGLILAVQSAKKSLISEVIFSRLGAYILITLAAISGYRYANQNNQFNFGFLISVVVVVFAQITIKNPLASFAIGFLSHILITIFS